MARTLADEVNRLFLSGIGKARSPNGSAFEELQFDGSFREVVPE